MTAILDPVSNGASLAIDLTAPYIARVTVQGTAPLLMHAWNCEAVEAKSRSAKNSAAKKLDNLESYVYRTDDGRLGIPGANFHGALIEAGRYMQDPRSPRKSARDLIKAALVPLDDIAPFLGERRDWDFIDQRRVTVQRAGLTRQRPAMRTGWSIAFELLVNSPEYVDVVRLQELTANAGRLVGLCDFRPTYGRFTTIGFSVNSALEVPA